MNAELHVLGDGICEKVGDKLFADLGTQVAELRTALKPFADVAENPEWRRFRLHDDGKFHNEVATTQPVSMDDLRRARDVLAKYPEGGQ